MPSPAHPILGRAVCVGRGATGSRRLRAGSRTSDLAYGRTCCQAISGGGDSTFWVVLSRNWRRFAGLVDQATRPRSTQQGLIARYVSDPAFPARPRALAIPPFDPVGVVLRQNETEMIGPLYPLGGFCDRRHGRARQAIPVRREEDGPSDVLSPAEEPPSLLDLCTFMDLIPLRHSVRDGQSGEDVVGVLSNPRRTPSQLAAAPTRANVSCHNAGRSSALPGAVRPASPAWKTWPSPLVGFRFPGVDLRHRRPD